MMNETSSKINIWLFWGLFVLLNMILYLPNFIANYEVSTFFPSSAISTGTWTDKVSLLFMRDNYDLFRIAADFVLLFNLLWLVKYKSKLQSIWTLSIIFFYLVQLYYNIYYEFYQKFYGESPYFLNDLVLLKEVLPIFLREVSFGYASNIIFPVLVLIIVSIIVVFLVKKLLSCFGQIKKLKSTKWILGSLIIFIFFSTINFSNSNYKPHWPTVQWMFPRLIHSLQLKNADKLKTIENEQSYRDNLKLKLIEKPDIYFIFIESYGTVATLSPELDSSYNALATELNQSLNDQGWHISSSYSVSPVIGGRSWLAFTTGLSGIKVENQIQYNDMINLHYNFPHIVRYFNNQGYHTYRMSTMSNVKTDTLIPENKINRYWGFNDWIMYNDIPYKGYKYDSFGGLPDQYALGYFEDEIAKNINKPKFLFFITMSSHGPWYDPPPIVEDWRDLDSIKESPTGKALQLTGEAIFRYQKSMEYELRMITKFIKEDTKENSIFILIGDHQPATLEYKIFGLAYKATTPIHIISKDSSFVNSFQDFGLQPSMQIDYSNKKHLQHQGIYSLFLRQLVKYYGEQGVKLPQYYPDGIQ